MSNADRPTYIHLPRGSWLFFGALLITPWLLVAWIVRHPAVVPASGAAPASPTVPKPATPASTTAAFAPLRAGPWGQLEYSRITIEPPSDFIPAAEAQPDALRWVFRGYQEADLRGLWDRAQLNPAQRQALDNPQRHEAIAGALVVRPDPETVIALSPEARTTIYTALAQFTDNPSQNTPFRLRADAAQNWFDDSGLPPEIVQLAKRLLYTRAGTMYFSDQDIILPRLAAPEARVRFLKTLSRKSATLVQLRVTPETNLEELAAYWGRGRRSKDLLALLQSLVRNRDGGTIDIVHLLPPFPRALLFTYPLPSEKPTDAAHDCHWTAFNFYKDQPDERFADINFVKETLLNSYYPVAGEPTFGDVLVLVQPDGVVVHSCVYLAAGLVFTKNGSAFSVPWVIGNLDQVVAFYQIGPPLEVRRFRLKN
jgi:hypothetical protein